MAEEGRGSQPAGGDVEPLPAALRQQMHGGGRLGLIIDIFFCRAKIKVVLDG